MAQDRTTNFVTATCEIRAGRTVAMVGWLGMLWSFFVTFNPYGHKHRHYNFAPNNSGSKFDYRTAGHKRQRTARVKRPTLAPRTVSSETHLTGSAGPISTRKLP